MRSEAENPGEGQKPEVKAGKRPALSWGKDISELMKTAHFPDEERPEQGGEKNDAERFPRIHRHENGRTAGRHTDLPLSESENADDGGSDAASRSDTDEIRRARQKALDLLTDMDRTEAQLREKLRRKEFSSGAVDDAIAYVKRFGYINDTHYADHYLEVYRDRKSRRRILYDLQKKGLSKEVIDGAFEKAGWYDERPLIRELAEKKAKTLDLGDPKDLRRLASYLGRLGFSGQDIYAVLDEMRREDHSSLRRSPKITPRSCKRRGEAEEDGVCPIPP